MRQIERIASRPHPAEEDFPRQADLGGREKLLRR